VLGPQVIRGRITYIDPTMNEETRTGKARIEIANPQDRLKVGMFVEIEFEVGVASSQELVVPEEAIQRMGERSVVFVADEAKPGHFTVRDVEAGAQSGNYRRVTSGLKAGERVASKGTFTLKSQLMKSQFGED
jgi:cobalt-zinc-cadmium efflux system membrane fusion protein